MCIDMGAGWLRYLGGERGLVLLKVSRKAESQEEGLHGLGFFLL